MVHFQNKWGRRGRIHWERASRRGLGAGVAERRNQRRGCVCEREREEEERKERKKIGAAGEPVYREGHQ
jgi:hypothetical protein